MTSTSRKSVLALILLLAVVWFGTLDYRKLIKPDEGRYSEIPREMVATGDWTTPRLNDIKYFYKPPLQYWATAAAFTAFGEHHWTARLWPALTGFAGILFAGFAAARLFNPTAGMIALAVLASSVLWNVIGHVNTLDMGVSFFLAAAIFALALALAQRDGASATESRRWLDGAWALLALAVLSKGLIGLVLPAATVVAYVLWQRDWGFILRIRPFRGLLILLFITAPWFIVVSRANPEFAHFFFIHEHFERFLTKTHGRYQPMWYFIPILLIGMLPWVGSLGQGLWRGLKAVPAQRFQPARFLLTWSVVVFGFFSVSSSKLASYILPIFPALAVLIGVSLSETTGLRQRWHYLPMAVLGAICLTLVPAAPNLASAEVPAELYIAYQPWLYGASIALILGGIAGFLLAKRGHIVCAALAMSIGGHLFGQLFLLGHDSLAPANSAYGIVQKIKDQVPAGVPFYSVDTYDQTFQFYLRRTTTMVSYRDEMSFGIEQEPHKFIPDLAGFEKAWAAAPQAWALMPLPLHQRYEKQGLPMAVVARDTRRIVVRKP